MLTINKNCSGTSLIEVLIALFIFTFCAYTLMSALIQISHALNESAQTIAMEIAKENEQAMRI